MIKPIKIKAENTRTMKTGVFSLGAVAVLLLQQHRVSNSVE